MWSGEEPTAKIDVLPFALVLLEIVVGVPVFGKTSTPKKLGNRSEM
jgi:hypothetical protein